MHHILKKMLQYYRTGQLHLILSNPRSQQRCQSRLLELMKRGVQVALQRSAVPGLGLPGERERIQKLLQACDTLQQQSLQIVESHMRSIQSQQQDSSAGQRAQDAGGGYEAGQGSRPTARQLSMLQEKESAKQKEQETRDADAPTESESKSVKKSQAVKEQEARAVNPSSDEHMSTSGAQAKQKEQVSKDAGVPAESESEKLRKSQASEEHEEMVVDLSTEEHKSDNVTQAKQKEQESRDAGVPAESDSKKMRKPQASKEREAMVVDLSTEEYKLDNGTQAKLKEQEAKDIDTPAESKSQQERKTQASTKQEAGVIDLSSDEHMQTNETQAKPVGSIGDDQTAHGDGSSLSAAEDTPLSPKGGSKRDQGQVLPTNQHHSPAPTVAEPEAASRADESGATQMPVQTDSAQPGNYPTTTTAGAKDTTAAAAQGDPCQEGTSVAKDGQEYRRKASDGTQPKPAAGSLLQQEGALAPGCEAGTGGCQAAAEAVLVAGTGASGGTGGGAATPSSRVVERKDDEQGSRALGNSAAGVSRGLGPGSKDGSAGQASCLQAIGSGQGGGTAPGMEETAGSSVGKEQERSPAG